uniref:Uncharacterized protein n=1 Tax=Solanum lycopersicum TaxID=4081 RepID=A0A3Q7FUM1_SOLLC
MAVLKHIKFNAIVKYGTINDARFMGNLKSNVKEIYPAKFANFFNGSSRSSDDDSSVFAALESEPTGVSVTFAAKQKKDDGGGDQTHLKLDSVRHGSFQIETDRVSKAHLEDNSQN